MKRNIFIVCGLVSLITVFGIVFFRYNFDSFIENTIFFNILTTFTAIFGVFAIAFQSGRSKELDEAKFIFDLNQQYINNTNYQKMLDVLETNLHETVPADIENIIAQHLDFFESIYILLHKGLIRISIIDDLFCFRFFSVVNNKYVQDNVLTPHKDYYRNIVMLHRIWKKYRFSKHLDIPLISSDLSLVDWYNDFYYHRKDLKNMVTMPISTIKVREAEPKDFASINVLYYQLLGQYVADVSLAEKLSDFKRDNLNYVWVASIEDRIVGTLQCTICQSIAYNGRPHMILEYFIVDKLYRCNGIGTLLLKQAESIAQKFNVKSIVLVSSGKLKSAHRFYRKMGFDSSVKGFRMDRR